MDFRITQRQARESERKRKKGRGSNHEQEEGPEGDAVVTHSEPPEVRPSRTLVPVALHALLHEEHVELQNLREEGRVTLQRPS